MRGAATAQGCGGSMRSTRWLTLALLTLASLALGPSFAECASALSASERFQHANEAARAGDYTEAIKAYRDLAGAGATSAALYWNWAQVARAQGARGESVWALMQAREIEPADAAIARALARLRAELNLDPAELAPEPLAQWRRWARWLHVDLVAAALFLASLIGHVAQRVTRGDRGRVAVWTTFGLGTILALLWILAVYAPLTAVVLRREAALLDAASPSADSIGPLREGEVVPVLARSGGYLRIQDSAGARGWARADDVAIIDAAP
jgi:hypothetical protein